MRKPNLPEIETRSVTGAVASTNDEKFELTGVAAAYMKPSGDLGGFTEMVMPGAFSRSLKSGADVKCLVNHSADKILGRVGNRTLVLRDGLEGLQFTVKLNRESSEHRDIFASVKRGDISACSFAFKVAPNGDRWDNQNGKSIRSLKDVDLFDVSITPYPAYPNATAVSARSVDYRLSARDIDAFHRAEARRLEIEILRTAPGYWIDEKNLTVRAMTQAEVDMRTDARNRVRAAELAQSIMRDQALAEIEAFKEELGI